MPKESHGKHATPDAARTGSRVRGSGRGAATRQGQDAGADMPAAVPPATVSGAPCDEALNFASGSAVAEVAHLMGDPARAHMLCALMGGMALTAGELANQGGVTAQTASGHLAQMVAARLLVVERQGRHRYFRLAGAEVADAVAALMALAATGPRRHRPPGPRDAALRRARTCYDHMAGRLAVSVAAALVARGHVEMADGAGLVTPAGRDFLADLGINPDPPVGGRRPLCRRPLCRTCLDWSERRPHLAGRLGAALLERFLALGWVARVPGSRALEVTRRGEAGFAARFGIVANAGEEA